MQSEQTRVIEWERGVMPPRPGLMPRLAVAIGMDALFLVADPGSPTLEDMRLAAGLTMQSVADELDISLRRYRGVEIGSTLRDRPDRLVNRLVMIFAVPTVTVRRAIDAARL